MDNQKLHQIIATERDHLGQVITLLQCVGLALASTDDPLAGPFYPVAIDAIVAMLAKTVDAFDPGNLPDD